MSRSPINLSRLVMLACASVLILTSAACGSKGDAKRAPTPAPTAVRTSTPQPQPIAQVRVPILMYHHLKVLAEDIDPEYRELNVQPKSFLEQVSYMRQSGYQTISFADLVGAFEGRVTLPEKPVIITFDDGWEDIYYVAFPILREQGLSATFFISTNWIENLEGTLTWAQIEELSEAGMEFGSHSVTHPYLTHSEPYMLALELSESKGALEKHTQQEVTALAYPFGLYDDNVIYAVQDAGYRAAATIDYGAWAYSDERFTMPRLWVKEWMDVEDFADLLETP